MPTTTHTGAPQFDAPVTYDACAPIEPTPEQIALGARIVAAALNNPKLRYEVYAHGPRMVKVRPMGLAGDAESA